MRKRLHILEMILKEKFPDIKVGFYLSKRKCFLHMVLDQSLASLGCYKECKEKIYKFFSVSLEESNFKLINPLLLIPTVRWKYDYVLIKKINVAMKYVPDFVPNDLKWYERDGLFTWYDQMKCERFLDVHNYFANTKIANFKIINKWLMGEEVSEGTLRNYQIVQKEEVFGYPIKEREKLMSAAVNSSVKRNVFVSKELIKEHLTSPLNDNIFLFSMKKRKSNEKAKVLFQHKSF